MSISKESIRKKREANRELIELDLRLEYEFGKFLTVHWDGKMLPDLTSDNQSQSDAEIDRLAIVVTGEGKSKLLGVPKFQMARDYAKQTLFAKL